MEKEKVLITTAIDYTNGVIHIGHAYQKILADTLARFFRAQGHPTFFLTGTDEHGQNIEKKAAENGMSPKDWCDKISAENKKQLESLNISYDRFIRTTDKDHEETSLWFYNKCLKNGDIYQGSYDGYYCEGCESYKTLSDLSEGKCSLHPTLELKTIKEKNWFFRWGKYNDFLINCLRSNSLATIPEARKNEMLSFLENGLTDIPITRQNIKWGFPAPNDTTQTIYVWFDALINYYTGAAPLGFWDTETKIIHIVGKDNTRWHVLLWPAMLKSAGLRLPTIVLNHSFLSLEGKKISKTLGNFVLSSELVEKYGTDPVRYYLLKYGPLFEDADLSLKRLEEAYNSDLVNGIGNHVARVLGIAEKYSQGLIPETQIESVSSPLREGSNHFTWKRSWEERNKFLNNFNVGEGLSAIFSYIRDADRFIDEQKPWELFRNGKTKELSFIIRELLEGVKQLAWLLYPFIPVTSEKIAKSLGLNNFGDGIVADKDSQEELTGGVKLDTSLKLFPRRK